MTRIIAEIGNNHEGDFDLAKRQIAMAATTGVDAVKFQSITPARLVSPADQARLKQLERFAFTPDQFAQLAKVAGDHGVAFLSTPFDPDWVKHLDAFVDAFKIASGDLTYTALLQAVARTGKPVYLSTGAADMAMIQAAIAAIKEINASADITVMHCVMAYPAPLESLNLRVIQSFEKEGWIPGYSDHAIGIDAAVIAAAMGARVIEKHFTHDHHHSDFRDHQLSANPAEMTELVRKVRNTGIMMGDGQKTIRPEEQEVAAAARRSVHLVRPLVAGAVLTPDDLDCLRPASGLSPNQLAAMMGRRLRKDLDAGHILQQEDLE